MKNKIIATSSILLLLLVTVILLAACGSQSSTPAPTEEIPTASATLESGTTQSQAAPTCPPCPSEETPMPQGGSTSGEGGDKVQSVEDVSEAVTSRTPVPTPTPGIIDNKITEFTTKAGLAGTKFLGLPIKEWINIGVTAILVVLIYFVGYWLLIVGVKWLAKRFGWKLNERFIGEIEKELKALIAMFAIQYGLLRLGFVWDWLRTLVTDLAFVIELILIAIILIRLISFLVEGYKNRFVDEENKRRITPLITSVQRIAEVIVLVVIGSIGLSHFGININGMVAAFVIVAGIIAYGAKDVIEDAISGFIILIDQPFRVGDSIEIEDVGTWGKVIDIGTRTTKIRTRDNREIIIPNSQIGSSQIINYSFPDPTIRVETKIGVAYGTDMKKIRKIIGETVHSVEGVLKDKPVSVQFYEFGGTTRMLRVQWWVENRRLRNKVIDQVNEALEIAMDEAGIDMPYDTYNVNVKMENDDSDEG